MPRNLNEQVVVITGASSGIGRVTARLFASRGARVVVGSRNIEALNDLVRQIDESGGVALAVQTDVTSRDQVERLAQSAINHFGRIDTWVNNAGVSIYATLDKLDDDEIRRVMDVNFMGTVYGMQAALSAMRLGGGTIINVASVAGKRAIPLQNVYSASKFAVVGISEAVRSEIINEGLDINLCTICPPSINTPFFDHARTKEGFAPKPPAPVYEPETVAEAIISCAERPEREVLIGSAGKGFAIINALAPGLADWFFGKAGRALQLTDEPKSESAQANLFNAVPDAREHGGWTVWGTRASNGHAAGSIVRQHPLVASAVVGAAALVVATRLLSRKF